MVGYLHLGNCVDLRPACCDSSVLGVSKPRKSTYPGTRGRRRKVGIRFVTFGTGNLVLVYDVSFGRRYFAENSPCGGRVEHEPVLQLSIEISNGAGKAGDGRIAQERLVTALSSHSIRLPKKREC